MLQKSLFVAFFIALGKHYQNQSITILITLKKCFKFFLKLFIYASFLIAVMCFMIRYGFERFSSGL